MPLGPGGLDANGIWLYGEDDSEALASDLLNLGMQSVSDVVASGVGRILQVVQTVKTDVFSQSVTIGAFSNEVTGLTATITPSSVSSKILVSYSVQSGASGNGKSVSVRLRRDGTAISGYIGDQLGTNRRRVSTSTENSNVQAGSNVGQYLDAPNTTSAVTYGFDMHHSENGSLTVYVNRGNGGDNTQSATSASTITLMEVAA